MTEPDLTETPDPLDAELKALIDDLKTSDATDPSFATAARERVRGRVTGALHEGPAERHQRVRGGMLLSLGLLIVISASSRFLVGSGTSSLTAGTPAATAPHDALTATAPVQGTVLATTHVDDLPSSAEAPVQRAPAIRPRTDPVGSREDTSADRDLAEEYRLVEEARSRLSSRDHAGALQAIRHHERRFPSGQLTQERERLAIQALVETGRIAEARERARNFRARFPNGLLLPSVMKAMASGSVDATVP